MADTYYPNPSGGAPITASSPADAASQGWTPSMGTYGNYTTTPGWSANGVSSPTGTGTNSFGLTTGATGTGTTSTGSASQLSAGINNMLGALASGNKAAFDESVREFNQTYGLDLQKFNASVDQFNQTYKLNEAATTGTFNGSPTQQAIKQQNDIAVANAALTGTFGGIQPGQTSWDQLSGQLRAAGGASYNDNAAKAAYQQMTGAHPDNFSGATPLALSQQQLNAIATAGGVNPAAIAGQQTQAAQQQQFAQGISAAGVTGQYNGAPTMQQQQQTYAQQMGLIAAAQTAQANPFRQQQLYNQAQNIFGGGAAPGAAFQAPTTVQGVGTAGGNTQGGMGYVQQMIDDIRSPAANQTTADQFMANTPTPNKIDSQSFLRSNPTTQNIILQSMQEKYGIDPTDAMSQIKATLPQFNAPNTVSTIARGG